MTKPNCDHKRGTWCTCHKFGRKAHNPQQEFCKGRSATNPNGTHAQIGRDQCFLCGLEYEERNQA